MPLTQAQRSRIAREKAKRQKNEATRLLRRTRTEAIKLCISVIDHLNNHSPSCPLFNQAVAPTISAIFPLRDQAEEVSLRFCIGSHRGKKHEGKDVIHEQTLVTVKIPPTFCALFHHHGLIHGGGPSKASSPRVFSIYAPAHDRVGISNQNYAVDTKCASGCSVCTILSSYKKQIGKELFNETMHEEMEVGDHATEHDLWQHGFAIVKVVTAKEFEKIHQEDLTHFLKKEEFHDIGQEEYITNGKRKMLYAGASLNANAVMNAKLAPSTLETMAKVDANTITYGR